MVVKTDEGFDETDHEVTVERAEDLTTGVIGDDVGDVRLGVEFGVAPDFAGDLNATAEFVEGVEGADDDVRGHGSFSYKFSVISYQFSVKSKASNDQRWRNPERSGEKKG